MSSAVETILEQLAQILGPSGVLTAQEDLAPYVTEDRGLYHGAARAVLRPSTVEQVARAVALINARGAKIVPQGGNTGLVGGQVPTDGRNQFVLSLKRLDKIRETDALGNTMTVEAGVTLQRVQEAAESVNRLFPLSLAAEGSCTIGGNLATNAGGVGVIAYGNARDLALGLEVVTADGRIMSTLGKLRKDNTGYDLRNLFIGSEGTLGIITAAVLKLFPRPRARATAFVGLASPEEALRLLELAQERAGADLKAFELICRRGLEFVVKHIPGARDPLAEAHPWYVLIELASQTNEAEEEALEALLGEAMERAIVSDAALASSNEQRSAFWRLRENLPEAQKHEGGSIKHDISVPVSSVPAFLKEAEAAALAFCPGARPTPFGHMGDGNIHFNVSQPLGADKTEFLKMWEALNDVVHAIAARYAGSISAEHGIGLLKRELLPRVKDAAALDAMRAIKRALDPNDTLNPGKVL